IQFVLWYNDTQLKIHRRGFIKRNIRIVILLMIIIGVFTACDNLNENALTDEADNTIKENDQDVITVATDNGYIPFVFIDEESGNIVGFDIDLITALAKELGYEIEFEIIEFDRIVDEISSGHFDVAIAG